MLKKMSYLSLNVLINVTLIKNIYIVYSCSTDSSVVEVFVDHCYFKTIIPLNLMMNADN